MSRSVDPGQVEEDSRREEMERDVRLGRLEAALGYRFSARSALEAALRHSSYAYERAQQADDSGESARANGEACADEYESNERLEFLGDAVLGLVVAEALYAAHPDWSEGHLTRARHQIVEGRSLAKLARHLELGPVLRLGRTEESSAGREKASILEDAMEALIGAIYLDGGLEPVRHVVATHFAKALAEDQGPVARDVKTALQETLMAEVGAFPTYRLIRDSGVNDDEHRFEMAVLLEGHELARGIGRTKRAAEKAAAREALRLRDDAADVETQGAR